MTRLEHLLARWDESSITAAEADELAGLLDSREARAELARRWSLSQALRDALPLAAPAPAPPYRPPYRLVAAAALLAVVACWVFWPRAPAPAPIATITDVVGEVTVIDGDGRPAPASAGQALYDGQSVETAGDDGYAAIAYAGSTRLELHAATRVRLSGGKVTFESGTMRAAVARREGAPLVLATPQGDLHAGESSVLLSSPAPGSTRVELEDGSAEMVSESGRVTEMGGGSYTYTDAGQAGPVEVPGTLVQAARSFEMKAGRALRYLPDGALQAASSRELRTLRGGVVSARALPGKKNEGRVFLGGGRLVLAAPLHATAYRLDTLAAVWSAAVRPAALAVSPDGEMVASAEPKARRVTLSTVKGGEARTLPLAGPGPCALAFGDGLLAAASTPRGGADLRLFPLAGGPARVLRGVGPTPRQIALSAGVVAASGPDGVIRLWGADASPVRTLTRHGRGVTALALSADGRLLAAGAPDGQAWLYDVASGEPACVIKAGPRAVWGLAFSPDGRRLAAGTQNGPVSEWNLPTL